MFDIGWSELVVIGVVALIAIGPKELPGVLRLAGQWIGKVRRMAAEFQGQFQEALREAEMEDLKKQVNEIGDTARDFANMDPLKPVHDEFDSSLAATRVDDPTGASVHDISHDIAHDAAPDPGHLSPSSYQERTPPSSPEGVETRAAALANPVPAAETPSDHAVAEVHVPADKAVAGGHSA